MSTPRHAPAQTRAVELSRLFAAFPQVRAVALGGSQSSGTADAESDIDLYVYTDGAIPEADLAALIEQAGGAIRADRKEPAASRAVSTAAVRRAV